MDKTFEILIDNMLQNVGILKRDNNLDITLSTLKLVFANNALLKYFSDLTINNIYSSKFFELKCLLTSPIIKYKEAFETSKRGVSVILKSETEKQIELLIYCIDDCTLCIVSQIDLSDDKIKNILYNIINVLIKG